MAVVLYVLCDNNTEGWKHPFKLQKHIKSKKYNRHRNGYKNKQAKKQKKLNTYTRKKQYTYISVNENQCNFVYNKKA